jgi:mannose-1-phosphate guanylyltransferase
VRFAVIMAGGSGERLWPLSTPKHPKPFLSLLGNRSLLQQTIDRLKDWIPLERTLIVVGHDHRDLAAEQLPGLPPENLLVEPVGRGTAACIGLAAVAIARRDPKAVIVVLPADHAIGDATRFRDLLARADRLASSGAHLVTLGVTPNRPATGYGYIQAGPPLDVDDPTALTVVRFTEKPDEKMAASFVARGDHYWNAGIFVWRTDAIRREIGRHLPALHQGLSEIEAAWETRARKETVARVYGGLEKISIDVGVMEKATPRLVLPTGEIGWNDVGDFAALAALLPTDAAGNAVLAPHTGIDTAGCLILSGSGEARRIATLGVSNLVIVQTPEGLLVVDKSRAQDLRDLVARQDADPPTDRRA